MDAWVAIGLRFAAYADLMLLAGLVLGGGLGRLAPAIDGRVIGGVAAIGFLITLAQFGATSLSMTGNDPAALDGELLAFLAFETPMGWSYLVRVALLGVLAVVWRADRARRPFVAALALVALGSLAWSGHAAASDGALGWLHRAGDIVHLVAAAVWIGALTMLTQILRIGFKAPESMATALAALERFSAIGAIVVGAIVVTGAINLLAIVGVDGLGAMLAADYGRLLLVKLALVGAMLGLAGLNRWRLVPDLGAAMRSGGHAAAARRLRRAVVAETTLAFVVLAVVAMLGTLSPIG